MAYTKTLGEPEGKLARTLIGGHSPSIAKAVMEMPSIREAILVCVTKLLNTECIQLCRKSTDHPSPF